jgi:hypothetical protein
MTTVQPAPWMDDAQAGRAHSVRQLQWYVNGGLYWAAIITATFVSKLAVPPLGAAGMSIAIPCVLAMLGIAFVFGCVDIDPKAAAAYMFVMGSLFAMQIFADSRYSMMSLILLAALHLPYVFSMARPPSFLRIVRILQTVGLIIAILGLMQYSLQFVVRPELVFPIENFIPKDFVVSLFNQQAPTSYGASTYRANGMVMVEPSMFSQLMALCVLIEMVTKQRWWYVAIAIGAMLVSFSGTGIIMLAVSVIVLMLERGKIILLVGGCVVGCLLISLAFVFDNIPVLSSLVRRVGEFSSEGSSGFARFVGGFYMFEQFLWPEPLRTLIGFGAGMFKYFMGMTVYPVAEMAVFKMVFEFGILGSILYFGFIAYIFLRSHAPLAVRAALGISLVLNGIYFPMAHWLALLLLVWVDPRYFLNIEASSSRKKPSGVSG